MSDSLKQNLRDALDKIQEAKDNFVSKYEIAKDEAPEGVSDATIILNNITELLAEAAAKTKVAYEEAGGITGISEKATKKAAELSASAKITYEDVVNSGAGQFAQSSVQSSAEKLSSTKVFQNAKDHALKLKDIAAETFEATYEAKRAEKAEKAEKAATNAKEQEQEDKQEEQVDK
ncbi:MAG: hypothetical protein LBI63_00555 [Candidatus Ancillula sp.]|jgi:hypothetical protein|nr:hypothetical protein [Candidatus Ancillula sp.]